MEDDNAESKLRPDAPSFVPPSVRTDFSHPLLPRHLHTHMQEYRRHVIVPPSPDNHVFENIAFTPSQGILTPSPGVHAQFHDARRQGFVTSNGPSPDQLGIVSPQLGPPHLTDFHHYAYPPAYWMPPPSPSPKASLPHRADGRGASRMRPFPEHHWAPSMSRGPPPPPNFPPP
eukprot:CAMPEP_0198222820 /NCGR_PEP_ID=MMETSP1445-20131203/89863_1 /TAXON_ID=36898 /ORGANISM="Pyramimonas sp., Strain CCMP2087" /LENGTH=172 /DNA_ID=CAMNT_0043901471 /DNA_START=184 /DNA_END=698 /DNA_ORIENTATION=-